MKSVSTGLENVNIKKTDIFKAFLKVFFLCEIKSEAGFLYTTTKNWEG